MHQLNVLALGPNSFINTLIELKPYLKFNLSKANNNLDKNFKVNYDILLFHEEFLENKNNKNIIDNLVIIKILASSSSSKNHTYDALLKFPTSINEINFIIEKSAIKKKFIENASIKIKNYSLDKNKKKLSKNNSFIILTEKEIQLLELFLNNTSSISKKEILSKFQCFFIFATFFCQ